MRDEHPPLRYPRARDVLVASRPLTERERWIDLRPGATNPVIPTKKCGVRIASADEDSRHMASTHPDIWATIQVLAEIAVECEQGGR